MNSNSDINSNLYPHMYIQARIPMYTVTHVPWHVWSALPLITLRQGQHAPMIAIYLHLTELGLQVHAATPKILHGCRGLELRSSCLHGKARAFVGKKPMSHLSLLKFFFKLPQDGKIDAKAFRRELSFRKPLIRWARLRQSDSSELAQKHTGQRMPSPKEMDMDLWLLVTGLLESH